jgi:nucleoside-diphosphate-sugar epimerase
MAGKTKRKTRVLVTGAGGFVGRRAVELAAEAGEFSIVATDLPGVDLSGAESAGAKVRPCDLTDADAREDLVKGIDLVLHIAAVTDRNLDRRALMRANHTATRRLAEAAAGAKVRHFVFMSSADVYGLPERMPANEESRTDPQDDYSFSKLTAEQALFLTGKETGMGVTAVRPSLIYGPGGVFLPGLFFAVPTLLQQLVGFTPRLSGGPLFNSCHVDDAAGAMLFLAGKKKAYGEAFNISDDDWLPLGEFIEKLWEPMGVNWKLALPMFRLPLKWFGLASGIFTPDIGIEFANFLLEKRWKKIASQIGIEPALIPRVERSYFRFACGDHVFDNGKIKQLGYRLRYPNFDRGYEQTVAWYREHKWLPEKFRKSNPGSA